MRQRYEPIVFSHRCDPQTEPPDETHSSTSRQAFFSGFAVKPVSHWHWKDPSVFKQRPSEQTPGFKHSSTSRQAVLLSLRVNPREQTQVKDPGVLTHSPLEKQKSPSRHSLTSLHCLPSPEVRYPGRQSHLNEPTVFTHTRSASHTPTFKHSSTSEQFPLTPLNPGLQSTHL